MSVKIEDILPILRCPRTNSKLRFGAGCLVSEEGYTYPIINGKPILVREIQAFHTTQPAESIVSQTTQSFMIPPSIPHDGICINLGSGNVPCQDPRVISIDILPNNNVDIIAESDCLPIESFSIDYIGSYSVFEHVVDPIKSIYEVKRILKDGGVFCIDTAFMQGYHGFPNHYFNMTPQAVEALLCDDFILENSFVPGHLSVSHSLVTQFDRFLEQIPQGKADMMRGLPLWAALDLLRAADRIDAPLLQGITEYAHRSLAASFTVIARKPAGYDDAKREDPINRQERLAYYAARMGVIQRHHEIDLYNKFIRDRGEEPPKQEYQQLGILLDSIKIENPMEKEVFRRAIREASSLDAKLTSQRDEVIRAFLS